MAKPDRTKPTPWNKAWREVLEIAKGRDITAPDIEAAPRVGGGPENITRAGSVKTWGKRVLNSRSLPAAIRFVDESLAQFNDSLPATLISELCVTWIEDVLLESRNTAELEPLLDALKDLPAKKRRGALIEACFARIESEGRADAGDVAYVRARLNSGSSGSKPRTR